MSLSTIFDTLFNQIGVHEILRKCFLPRKVSSSTMTIAFAMLLRWNHHAPPQKLRSSFLATAYTTGERTVASDKKSAQKSNSSNERHRRLEMMPTSQGMWVCEYGVRTNSKLARRLNSVSTFNKWNGILAHLTMFLEESSSRVVIVIRGNYNIT